MGRRIAFVQEVATVSKVATVGESGARPYSAKLFGYGDQHPPPAPQGKHAAANGAGNHASSRQAGKGWATLRLAWPRVYRIGPGLVNLGNTCFLNSVLQSLAYTAPLTTLLLSREHSASCRMNACPLCLMEGHVHKCFGGGAASANTGASSHPILRPGGIVQVLRKIAKHMRLGRQEDAHEFYRYLLDSFQDACLQGAKKADKALQHSTLVHRIFGGHLRSQVKCLSCGHQSNTYDPFLDLSLELQSCDSLERSLTLFTKAELLTKGNKYRCDSCKGLVDAQKRITIQAMPHVLSLHLKRFGSLFGSRSAKVNKPIRFPETLDMQPYVSSSGSNGSRGECLRYRLYAVIVHAGHTCNSGHYYSYVRSSNGAWYCMDDTEVSQVSLNTVLKQQAYMLQYVRDVDVGVCVPFQEPGLAAIGGSSAVVASAQPSRPGLGSDHALGNEEQHGREAKRRKRKHKRDKENVAPLQLCPAPTLLKGSAVVARPAFAATSPPTDVGVVVRPDEVKRAVQLVQPTSSDPTAPVPSPSKSASSVARAKAVAPPGADTQAQVDAIFAKHVPSTAGPTSHISQPEPQQQHAPKAQEQQRAHPARVNATGRWVVIDVATFAPAPTQGNGLLHPGRQQQATFPTGPRFGVKTIRPWAQTETEHAAERAAEEEERRAANRHIKRPSKEDLLYDRGKPKKRKLLDPAFPVWRASGDRSRMQLSQLVQQQAWDLCHAGAEPEEVQALHDHLVHQVLGAGVGVPLDPRPRRTLLHLLALSMARRRASRLPLGGSGGGDKGKEEEEGVLSQLLLVALERAEVDVALLRCLALLPTDSLLPALPGLLHCLHKHKAEEVRLEAARLAWGLVGRSSLPDYAASPASTTPTPRSTAAGPQVVAAFCDVINDLSPRVRRGVLELLGSLPSPGTGALLQMLSKKPIQPPDAGSTDPPLLPAAHGTLIQGLEDELEEVRNTTIDTIRQHALADVTFAGACIDAILDMCVDEMVSVRWNAITTFRALLDFHAIRMTESQLLHSTIVLHDASLRIRREVYELLGFIDLRTVQELEALMAPLHRNLARFPEDRALVHETMLRLGQQNAALVSPLVPKLLALRGNFLPQEKDIGDPVHLSHLHLLYGAGVAVQALLPEYVRGKQFLRIAAQCAVWTRTREQRAKGTEGEPEPEQHEGRDLRARGSVARTVSSEWRILPFCLRLCRMGQWAKAAALLAQLRQSLEGVDTSAGVARPEGLQSRSQGLGATEHFLLDMICLLSLALQTQVQQEGQGHVAWSGANDFRAQLLHDLEAGAERLLCCYTSLPVPVRTAIRQLLQQAQQAQQQRAGSADAQGLGALDLQGIALPDELAQQAHIQRKHAQRLEAKMEMSHAHALLPKRLSLRAELHHLSREVPRLRLQVVYADGLVQCMPVRTSQARYRGRACLELEANFLTPPGIEAVPTSLGILYQGPEHAHLLATSML